MPTTEPEGSPASGEYLPQLDGVRAIAISLVLIAHFWLLGRVDVLRAPAQILASMGVDLFFVLSGFLITGILRAARRRAERGEVSFPAALGRFYVRRILRIFPIYYLAILILGLLGVPAIANLTGWYLTYTINWRLALIPASLPPTTHFWTLAVEEQFYLLWPGLILFLPRRGLVPTILALCFLAAVTRGWLWYAGAHLATIRMNTVACLDYLALGALLAVLSEDRERYRRWLRLLTGPGLWIGGTGVLWFLIETRSIADARYTAFASPFVALVSLWLVDRAARGVPDAFGRLLSSRPFVATGRVSYGIYVYHLPVLWAWVRFGPSWTWTENPVMRFALLTALTGILAAASWKLIEKPINGLKRHFPYGAV